MRLWTRSEWAQVMGCRLFTTKSLPEHYSNVMMDAIASQITSLTIVYSTVYSSVDQRKHQSSASLAFVWGIHRWPVNSPHKWPVTRKMFPFDDVIVTKCCIAYCIHRRFSDISIKMQQYSFQKCHVKWGRKQNGGTYTDDSISVKWLNV